ncbi:MAG: EAL domain-containing protein [Sphingomonadales bacterium]|nr:EAL domain-containing protein [Sphingomonadales bacterium]
MAPSIRRAERDIVSLGIAAAGIILFVGTGGEVLPQLFRSWLGVAAKPEPALINALLLDIALIIFGWRRYRELLSEVEQRRKAEEQARALAETDPMTGCLNRRSIGPATDRLAAAAAEKGEVVAFLMIDIDNFKLINDFNGHTAGDVVLLETARRMAALLPAGASLARIGGDEFACVVAFEPNRPERIDQLAGDLIAAASQPIPLEAGAVEATVSIGITRSDIRRTNSDGPSDAKALLHMADIAMYHAKKRGRNRSYWFEASMESELRFRAELESGIRAGIPRGEFVPYYEQQIDLDSGTLAGFEMLARWNSPQFGLVGPEVFIPIAEEIGVIAELSESVIRQALVDAHAWNPRLTLSVNISPLQLRDPWFAQKLLKMLVTANFPPARLDIEITENCLHENVGVVRTLIASLKNQGVGISLDDFGTGYSSLSQLRTLPFDRIKIDRSFVTTLTESKDSATIVQAIASLGDGLGLPITAEGIESAEVLDRLRDFGSFKGQGYLYGRPQSGEATGRFLEARGLLAAAPPVAAEPPAAEPPLLQRSA